MEDLARKDHTPKHYSEFARAIFFAQCIADGSMSA
jgi:hypothetical protein